MKNRMKSKKIPYAGAVDREKEPLVPHANAFPSAMMSLGVLMGLNHDTKPMRGHGMQWRKDLDYNLHNGVSGEAFRFLFDTAEYFRFSMREGAEPLQDCLSAIGLPSKVCARNAVKGIADVWASDDQLQNLVIENLCDGFPALLLGRTESDRVLLAIGFEDHGDTLIAWTFSPGNDIPNKSFSPEDCQYISNWSNGIDAVVLVRGEPSRQPTEVLAGIYRRTLVRSEASLRAQRSAPYGVETNYYDNWIAGLQDENFWAASVSGFPYIYPEIWDLAERRYYGAEFLQSVGRTLGTKKLAPAVTAGKKIHRLMWQIHALCNEGNQGNSSLRDPAVRKRIVTILDQCRALDIEMADAIADTLA